MTEKSLHRLTLSPSRRAALREELCAVFASGIASPDHYKTLWRISADGMIENRPPEPQVFCLSHLAESLCSATSQLCCTVNLSLPKRAVYISAAPAAFAFLLESLITDALIPQGNEARVAITVRGGSVVINVKGSGFSAAPALRQLADTVCGRSGGSFKTVSDGIRPVAAVITLPVSDVKSVSAEKLYYPPLDFEYIYDKFSPVNICVSGYINTENERTIKNEQHSGNGKSKS